MRIPNTKIDLIDYPASTAQELAYKNSREFAVYFSEALRRLGHTAVENIQAVRGDLWEREGAPDMLKSLAGKVVVDLGCGDNRRFSQFLGTFGPHSYIGVDQLLTVGYRPYEKTEVGAVMPLSRESGDGVDGALVKADMLDFVSRLPDASCSFVINGVDHFMLDASTPYAQELIKQVDRTTAPDGYVLGVTENGGILEEYGQLQGYEAETAPGHLGAEFFSYRKLAA